jgi:hypothetical protein
LTIREPESRQRLFVAIGPSELDAAVTRDPAPAVIWVSRDVRQQALKGTMESRWRDANPQAV